MPQASHPLTVARKLQLKNSKAVLLKSMMIATRESRETWMIYLMI